MPSIGLGVGGEPSPEELVKAATEIGYRCFDTASLYKTEPQLGEALSKVLADGLVKRDELFIITKIWIDEVEDVEAACRRSLERLKLDYVDLYLIHWPLFTREVEKANPDTGAEAKYERINIPIHKVWT